MIFRTMISIAVLATWVSAETIVFSMSADSVAAEEIEVSPDGPLRTLESGRDRIRSLRAAGSTGPFNVILRAGLYRLSQPFVLLPEDSGTSESPITYSAFPGEHVVISGGRELTGGWERGTTEIWTKSIPEVKDGHWNFHQLFVNGVRARRARSPNVGYYRITGPSSKDKPFRLNFSGTEIQKKWENTGAEAIVMLGWTEIRQQIVQVDPTTGVAVLSGDAGGSAAGIPEDIDSRYFVENAPETLDVAREWYLDRSSGQLSYWPGDGENLTRAEVVAPALPQLVRLEGNAAANQIIRNVAFRGLHFCDADWDLPNEGHSDHPQAAVEIGAAFEADGAQHCTIEDCSFERLGRYAIWFRNGCQDNRIVGNQISDIGAGGIKLGETVKRENLVERNHGQILPDNIIHHLGIVYPEAVGIWIGQSSRNTISHNTIHDVHYTGISVGWTWGYEANLCDGHTIEFNHIHDIGKSTLNDLGAIYTLGQQPHTVIRNNLIHDVNSFADRGRGIYLDEGSTGILVENNIVYRCKSAGFHQHYGRDNLVRNNIFAFNLDAQFSRARAEPHNAFTFKHNIVYFDTGKLIAGAWKDDKYIVRNNIYFDSRGGDMLFGGVSLEEWCKRTGDETSPIADPGFRSPNRFDFSLSPNSPATAIGFQPFDLQQAGARIKKYADADKSQASEK